MSLLEHTLVVVLVSPRDLIPAMCVAGVNFQYRDPERGFNRGKVKGVLAKLVHLQDPATTTALEVAAGGKLYQVGTAAPSSTMFNASSSPCVLPCFCWQRCIAKSRLKSSTVLPGCLHSKGLIYNCTYILATRPGVKAKGYMAWAALHAWALWQSDLLLASSDCTRVM